LIDIKLTLTAFSRLVCAMAPALLQFELTEAMAREVGNTR
jgi:hypothetical protein